jgi:hypothetical protein
MPSVAIAAFALIAAPLLVFAAIRWRRTLLMALPTLVILNGVPLTIRGTQVRVDQLAAVLLMIALSVSAIAGARRMRMDATSWWLVALVALNMAASLRSSPARSYSLLQCANFASAWLIYLVLINYLDTREELDAFFTRCLWSALVASVLGIAAFLLESVGIPVGGANVTASAAEHLTNAFGAYGTMIEPNLFGSFTGAHLILAMVLLVLGLRDVDDAPRRRLLRWMAALAAIGLVLSFTRSAWIGTFVGAMCAVMIARRERHVRARQFLLPLTAATALVVVLLLLPGYAGAFLRFKLDNIVNLDSRTATLRLFTYTLALDQTLLHPILGWGTYSFAPLAAQGADFARFEGWRSLWIGNYLLLALHDTGVVGLAMWLCMLWSIVSRGLRAWKELRPIDPETATRCLALSLAIVSLLVSFLATTGFSLGFPWMLIGLLGAHVRLMPHAAATRAAARHRAELPSWLVADAS